jgi:hypothetical protein
MNGKACGISVGVMLLLGVVAVGLLGGPQSSASVPLSDRNSVRLAGVLSVAADEALLKGDGITVAAGINCHACLGMNCEGLDPGQCCAPGCCCKSCNGLGYGCRSVEVFDGCPAPPLPPC